MSTTSPRPGRPPGRRGADLLAVAREVFLEHGFRDASMLAIAARAGVSKASLYREHPSKDALFAAVVADWAAQGVGAMTPALDAVVAADDIGAGLLDLVLTIQGAVLDDAPLRMRRLVASEADRAPEVAALYAEASWGANTAQLAEALAVVAGQGRLSIADPLGAATRLLWMAVGEALNAQTLGAPAASPDALRTAAVGAVTTFLAAHGVGADDAP